MNYCDFDCHNPNNYAKLTFFFQLNLPRNEKRCSASISLLFPPARTFGARPSRISCPSSECSRTWPRSSPSFSPEPSAGWPWTWLFIKEIASPAKERRGKTVRTIRNLLVKTVTLYFFRLFLYSLPIYKPQIAENDGTANWSKSVSSNSGLCFYRCVLLKRVWQIYPLKKSKKHNFKIFKETLKKLPIRCENNY